MCSYITKNPDAFKAHGPTPTKKKLCMQSVNIKTNQNKLKNQALNSTLFSQGGQGINILLNFSIITKISSCIPALILI